MPINAVKIKLAIALALNASRRPDESAQECIQRFQLLLPAESNPTPLPEVSAGTDELLSLRARIKSLETQLEKAEAEADLAKIELDTHIAKAAVVTSASQDTPSSTRSTSSGAKKRKPAPKRKVISSSNESTVPDVSSEPPKKKAKKNIKTNTSSDIEEATAPKSDSIESDISLKVLLKCIKNESTLPDLTSSLDVLESIEAFHRNGQTTLSSKRHPIRFQAHVCRTISSISQLIKSTLSLGAPPGPSLPSLSTTKRSSTDTKTVLKASSALLNETFALISTDASSLSSQDIESIASSLSSEIISPLILAFYTLSTRLCEFIFNTSASESTPRVKDHRSNMLSFLTNIVSLPPIWSSSIIPCRTLDLSARELLRLITAQDTPDPTNAESMSLDSPDQSPSIQDQLIREETVWFICALMGACCRVLSSTSSPLEEPGRMDDHAGLSSREVLLRILKIASGVGMPFVGYDARRPVALSVVERRMITAAVEKALTVGGYVGEENEEEVEMEE